MTKESSKGWAAIGKATKDLAQQDQLARAEADRDRGTQRGIIPLTDVKARPHGDTRRVDARHVLDLAESLSALGLLEPLVVDRRLHLLAGAHRWEAMKLLAIADPEDRAITWRTLAGIADPEARTDIELLGTMDRVRALKPLAEPVQVHVRIVEVDASAEADRALAIEVAENEKRRDYTKQEVTALAERLQKSGYRITRGKPKAGERALGPALAVIIGKSERTIRRLMGASDSDVRTRDLITDPVEVAIHKLLMAAGHFTQVTADSNNHRVTDVRPLLAKLVKQLGQPERTKSTN